MRPTRRVLNRAVISAVFKRRYGDQRTEVFYTAVTAGRVTKGMPPWGQALSNDEIWQVWTFLESIQAEP